MIPHRIIIVGPSASGKSTVAEDVSTRLRLPIIHMDDFRIKAHRNQPRVKTKWGLVRSYEDPTMWDGHAIACKLRALVHSGSGFVVEGNHLLRYPEITALAMLCYPVSFYIDVPFRVSLSRRKARHRHMMADESFALIGESETDRWVVPQKKMPGVTVIDGTMDAAAVVAAILQPLVAA